MTGIALAKRQAAALRCAGFALFALNFAGTAAPIQGALDSSFAVLSQEFDRVADDAVLKKPRLSSTDIFFVKMLKTHQTFFSLARTNRKGVIVNEVKRGRRPERRYRDASRQPWFAQVAAGAAAYRGLVKEGNGRYCLLWSRPIHLSTGRTSRRFAGAISAEIDLWDCFRGFSESTAEPFLARVNGISLYASRWKGDSGSVEAQIAVPGVERASVRYVPAQPTAPVTTALQPPPLTAQVTPPPAAVPAKMSLDKGSPRLKIFAAALIVALLVLSALVVRMIGWVRRRAAR